MFLGSLLGGMASSEMPSLFILQGVYIGVDSAAE